jgi:hypothetical protein
MERRLLSPSDERGIMNRTVLAWVLVASAMLLGCAAGPTDEPVAKSAGELQGAEPRTFAFSEPHYATSAPPLLAGLREPRSPSSYLPLRLVEAQGLADTAARRLGLGSLQIDPSLDVWLTVSEPRVPGRAELLQPGAFGHASMASRWSNGWAFLNGVALGFQAFEDELYIADCNVTVEGGGSPTLTWMYVVWGSTQHVFAYGEVPIVGAQAVVAIPPTAGGDAQFGLFRPLDPEIPANQLTPEDLGVVFLDEGGCHLFTATP